MGLDMYAYATSRKPATPVDFKDDSEDKIHYWCKHPNMYGWMERLYRAKGDTDKNFNCVNVELTASDLDALEACIQNGTLPETSGFFFGTTDGSEREDDLAFMA